MGRFYTTFNLIVYQEPETQTEFYFTGEVFHDAQENFPRTGNPDGNSIISDDLLAGCEYPCCLSNSFRVYPATIENGTSRLHTPPPPHGPNKRRRMSINCDVEVDTYSEADPETTASPIQSQTSYASDCVKLVKATHYRDILISFRFSDPNLPFKLKEIIMSDLRLLTLLESGLPSWVIFLQSYPGFCHIYRPWMCPLARALYVIISIVTVLIGFYDLYKNVPLLTATASHLFGPLFDWIESWEMISRIEYLGTMLFLQNFRKAFKWFIMITRPIRSFLSILTQPMAGLFVEFLDFFLPFWNMCIEFLEGFFSLIWMMVESFCTLAGELVEFLLVPLWYILSFMWNVVTSLMFPLFWILVEILFAPIRFGLGLCNLVALVCRCMYDLIGDIYLIGSDTFQFTTNVESTVSSYEVSMWRSLWNDIFSQVFRALRSILNGLVAFFVACNRHRLSIYNHVKEFIQKLSAKRTRAVENIHDRQAAGSQKTVYKERLISDLFDKLFTSEFIELHGSKEMNVITMGRSLICLDLKMDLVLRKKLLKIFCVDDDRETTGEPILEDLGIVYAHGNEDIFNFAAGNREKGKLSTGMKDTVTTQPYHPALWTRRSDVEGECETCCFSQSTEKKPVPPYSSLSRWVWKRLSLASGYYQQLLQSVKKSLILQEEQGKDSLIVESL